MSGATAEGLYACDAGAAGQYDPAFKLFGRTIPVLSVSNRKRKCGEEDKNAEEISIVSTEESYARSCVQDVGDEASESEDQSLGASASDELGSSAAGRNDGCEEEKPNEGIGNNFDIPCPDASLVSGADVPIEGNDGDTQTTELDDGGAEIQDAVPKKPEKPVPCPRCESLDTKFCYFNNYNVNQPRHFCKNCQRYWTSGGTLRNVPVGAGRRKSKHTGAQHRNMPPDALVVRRDSPDSAQQLLSCPGSSPVGMSKHLKMGPSPSRLHLQSLDVCSLAALDSPSSSTILNFGQESPFRESIGTTSYSPHAAEVLTGYKSEVTQGRFNRTTYVPSEADVGSSSRQMEEDSKSPNENQIHGQSSVSDVSHHETDAPTQSTSRPVATVQPLVQPSLEPKGDPSTLIDQPSIVDTSLGWGTGAPLAFMGGPWQYGGIVGWNDASLATSMSTALSPNSNTTGANPQATVSVSHPPWGGAIGSLWGGVPWPFIPSPMWGPQFWGGAWTVPWAAGAAAPANSVLGSPTLGKRPLGQEESNRMEKEGSLWVPKTLRIDDPGEAAQSSIWMALGLDDRSESKMSKTSGGIFSRLQTKTESKEAGNSPIHAWHSNPAAMTRSMAFQESGLVSSQITDVQGV